MDEVRERGARMRAQLNLPIRTEVPAGIRQDYQGFIDRYVFGETWCREEIDLRTRSIATVSMLIAQGRSEQLAHHVKTALGNGVTRDELRGIIWHGAVYCGVPAASAAFSVATEVFDTIDSHIDE